MPCEVYTMGESSANLDTSSLPSMKTPSDPRFPDLKPDLRRTTRARTVVMARPKKYSNRNLYIAFGLLVVGFIAGVFQGRWWAGSQFQMEMELVNGRLEIQQKRAIDAERKIQELMTPMEVVEPTVGPGIVNPGPDAASDEDAE